MNLDLNNFKQNLQKNKLIENFLEELGNDLKNYDKKLSNKNNNFNNAEQNIFNENIDYNNKKMKNFSNQNKDLNAANFMYTNNNIFDEMQNFYSIDEFIDKNFNLTQKQYFEFNKKKDEFLQNYFCNSKFNPDGNLFLVTNKYKNDFELNRYKLAQYKNNAEYKYVVSKNELPADIQLGDVLRKVNSQYIKNNQVTEFVKKSINEILKQVIN